VQIHKSEETLSQRAVIVFDHCMAKLDANNEDEIMIYHLISCLYILNKVESSVAGLEFKNYLHLCV